MDASTTIVNVNPEHFDKLMDFIGDMVGSKVEKPTNVSEFSALMVANTDALLEGAEEGDAEGCFQVLFKDMQLEADPAVVARLVGEITGQLTANTESKPLLRLRILGNLYNVLSSVTGGGAGRPAFVSVLLAIISFAGKIGQLSKLQGYFDLLDVLVIKWDLGVDDARELFLAVSLALESQGLADQAQLFLIKYLATFGKVASAAEGGATSAAALGADEVALAAKGSAGAVRAPIVGFRARHNLLGLKAVDALRSSKEHAPLHALLAVFGTGQLKDYLSFPKRAEVLAKYGLDHDACVANMRLLSMCSLASEQAEIPYDAIAKALDVPLDEVEAWVVKTISAQLIEAKMDQLTGRVLISRCTHRVFGPEQWRALQTKLDSWKLNVRGMLETLSKAHAGP